MNMRKLAKQWKTKNKDFIEQHKHDKILLNYEWQMYLDSLCKSGEITQKQLDNASNLF